MAYDLGDTARLVGECRDPAGELVTADSVTVTISLPDGTTTTPAVPPPSTPGVYTVDYVTTQPGRHEVRWVWEGPAAAYTEVFEVRPASSPALFSLAEAKDFLNIPSPSPVQDEELRGLIEATTAVVEHYVGPVVRRTLTEDHAGGSVLVLRRPPVLELVAAEAVLDDGPSYAVADLDVTPDGVVRHRAGLVLRGPLRVTYTAGRPVVPAHIRTAALVILRHLWRTQTGPGLPPLGGADDYDVGTPVPGLGYAVPNRALELLAPDRLPPGVA